MGECYKKSVWAFGWIRMLKALIGKVTKFRKRRVENVRSVDMSNSLLKKS